MSSLSQEMKVAESGASVPRQLIVDCIETHNRLRDQLNGATLARYALLQEQLLENEVQLSSR